MCNLFVYLRTTHQRVPNGIFTKWHLPRSWIDRSIANTYLHTLSLLTNWVRILEWVFLSFLIFAVVLIQKGTVWTRQTAEGNMPYLSRDQQLCIYIHTYSKSKSITFSGKFDNDSREYDYLLPYALLMLSVQFSLNAI